MRNSLKTALALVAVLIVLMGVTSRQDLDDEDVLRLFFPGVEAKDVVELQYWADVKRSGYRICARVILQDMAGSPIARGEQAAFVPAPEAAETRERWVLEVGGRAHETLADMVEGILVEAPWLRRVDPSSATAHIDRGGNALSTDYIHWWILPKDEANTVYLVGAGT